MWSYPQRVTRRIAKDLVFEAPRGALNVELPLDSPRPVELPRMTEMFPVGAVQYGSHQTDTGGYGALETWPVRLRPEFKISFNLNECQ